MRIYKLVFIERWKIRLWILMSLIIGVILGALLRDQAYAINKKQIILSPHVEAVVSGRNGSESEKVQDSRRLETQGDKTNTGVSKNIRSFGNQGTPGRDSEFHSIVSGRASWYGSSDSECLGCSADRITASGRKYNEMEFTAACAKRWSLGTALEVRHREKMVRIVCTDRGGFETKYGRVLDLSKASFAQLVPLDSGVIDVEVIEGKYGR